MGGKNKIGQGNGKETFMEFMFLAEAIEPALAPVNEAWRSIAPSKRYGISIDNLCETAAPTLKTAHICGLVAEAAMTWGLNAGNLFAALNHEKVVEASIKAAVRSDGYHDRRMQFLHSGFLPELRGPGNVFNVSAHAEAEAQAAAGAKVMTPGLPPFELETIERAKLIRDDDADSTSAAAVPEVPEES
jgi:hypothetical protein